MRSALNLAREMRRDADKLIGCARAQIAAARDGFWMRNRANSPTVAVMPAAFAVVDWRGRPLESAASRALACAQTAVAMAAAVRTDAVRPVTRLRIALSRQCFGATPPVWLRCGVVGLAQGSLRYSTAGFGATAGWLSGFAAVPALSSGVQLLAWLRMGAFWFAPRLAHLHGTVGRAPAVVARIARFSGVCPACGVPGREDAAHLLLYCAAWNAQRGRWLQPAIVSVVALMRANARVNGLAAAIAVGLAQARGDAARPVSDDHGRS